MLSGGYVRSSNGHGAAGVYGAFSPQYPLAVIIKTVAFGDIRSTLRLAWAETPRTRDAAMRADSVPSSNGASGTPTVR